MHASIFFAFAPLAAFASAQVLIGYDCDAYKSACETNVANGATAQEICTPGYTACLSCVTQEHSCRVGAADDIQSELECTVHAQLCYQQAVSAGTLNSYYGCEEARDTCSFAPDANQSVCGSQFASCKACEDQEDKCRTAPEANQSFCSSQASGCYNDAITLNGDI